MNDPVLPPDPTFRSIVVLWDPATNEITVEADTRMSCFDLTGVLSHALDIAVMSLPSNDYDSEEYEDD